MFCHSCGSEIAGDSNFCEFCGAGVEAAAPPHSGPHSGPHSDEPAAEIPPPPAPAATPLTQAPQPPAPQPPAPSKPEEARIDDLRPRLVEVDAVRVSEKTIVIKNLEKHTYLELSEEDADFINYLDGRHTVTQILKEMFERTGRMSFKRFYTLLVELYAHDFLEPGGLDALEAAGAGDAGKKAGGIFARIASIFERFEVPLPPLAAVMGGLALPLRLLLNLPAQAVIFLLCVVPVVLASLLQSSYMEFLGPLKGQLLSAVQIFGAPSQKGYNIFLFNGSYVLGLVFAYMAAFCVLSVRTLVRGAALLHFGSEAYRPALRSFYGIFYLDVDGRDIAMTDRTGRMVYHAAGITSTLIIGTAINIAQHLAGFNHMLYLVYIIAYAVTFVNLCVFFRSDLFLLLDAYFELPHLRKHASTYVRQKFFHQILNFRSSFPEEKALTTIACLGLVWLFLAVNVVFALLRDNVAMLTNDFGETRSLLTKLVIGLFLVNIVAPFAIVIASFAALILRNVGTLAGAPLGRMLRRMAASRGRKPADPDEIAGFIAGVPLFMNLSRAELHRLSGHLHQVQFRAGQNVVVQGDTGDSFYIIMEGAADVIIESPSGLRTTVDTITKGDSFGEIALLEHVPRTATIRAAEPLTVLELNKALFGEFVLKSADAREKITDVIRLTALLKKIPFFEEMAASRIPDIMSRLEKLQVTGGQTIIQEGSPGNLFYIISEGAFKVLKNAPGGGQKLIAELEKNESFGEIALLHNVPRTSSVVAETDGILLTLSRDEFLSVANTNIQAGLVLEEETERRLAELKRKSG
ncbi:MAG: cyclic nucleotide-binding domain-containing protein [bacterium]